MFPGEIVERIPIEVVSAGEDAWTTPESNSTNNTKETRWGRADICSIFADVGKERVQNTEPSAPESYAASNVHCDKAQGVKAVYSTTSRKKWFPFGVHTRTK